MKKVPLVVLIAAVLSCGAAQAQTFYTTSCCVVSAGSSAKTDWTIIISVTNSSRDKAIKSFEDELARLKQTEYRRQNTSSSGLFSGSTISSSITGPTYEPVTEADVDKIKDFLSGEEWIKIKEAVRKANGK